MQKIEELQARTIPNWSGPDDGVGAVFQSYKTAVADALREAVQGAR